MCRCDLILKARPRTSGPARASLRLAWRASRLSDKGFLFGAKEGRHGGAERRGRAGFWCRMHSEQTAEKGPSRETNSTIDPRHVSNGCFNERASSVGLFSFRESWSFWWSGGDGRPSKYERCCSARNNENNNNVSLVALSPERASLKKKKKKHPLGCFRRTSDCKTATSFCFPAEVDLKRRTFFSVAFFCS